MKTIQQWGLLVIGGIIAVLCAGIPAHAMELSHFTINAVPFAGAMGATIGAGVLNIVDVAKSFNPDGSIAKVAEILNRVDEVMYDVPFVEGNLDTGEQLTLRTQLPTPTWRRMNQGVSPTKSRKNQIVEACGELADISTVDVSVANIGGNPGAVRLSESEAHIEGMNQEFINCLFYGAASTPEKFIGFSPRYSSLEAGNSQNIINAGGTSSADNTSIWIVGWGKQTVYGIYPKGSQGGLQHRDLGEQLIAVTAGNPGSLLLSYVDDYKWQCGLAIKDYRYAVRIANIDVAALVSETAAADLTNLLIRGVSRIPSASGVNLGIYMNRTLYEMLAIQRREDVRAGGQLKYENVDGKLIPFFMGIPVRKTDGLLLTEAAIS